MRYHLLLLILLSGCGFSVKVEPLPPVEVNHSLDLNFEQIMLYCRRQCEQTDPTNVDVCTDNCYTNFMQLLMSGAL